MKSYVVTIQVKATEYCFPVVLCIMLCKVVLPFESLDGILWCIIQMKATEQHVHVVLFIMLGKKVLNFVSVNKIIRCDHSNESY